MAIKKTIPSLLRFRINQSSESNALGYIVNNSIHYITYKEYYSIIKRLTYALIELGVQRKEHLAILSKTRRGWHFFDMAIFCSKGTSVPIYPHLNSKAIIDLLRHSDSSYLIVENLQLCQKVIEGRKDLGRLKMVFFIDQVDQGAVEKLRKTYKNTKFLPYHEVMEVGEKAMKESDIDFDALLDTVEENDIASIIYTSGTTEVSKGAMISQKAFYRMLHNLKETFNGCLDHNDRTLVFLPLSHVLGRCDSLLILPFGIKPIYAESIDKVLENLMIARPTIVSAVPRTLEKIYKMTKKKFSEKNFIQKKLIEWAEKVSCHYYEILEKNLAPSSLEILEKEMAYNLVFKDIYQALGGEIRFFVCGGAALSSSVIKFLRNANFLVLEGYGLTETVAPCSLNSLSKQSLGTVGVPIGDVRVKFAPDNEILIKSEALFDGYYKNLKETKEALDEEGYFHTGDLGELTFDGALKITGRKKDIIVTSSGKNVSPQKIESVMQESKYISHFIVCGEGRDYLTGLISLDSSSIIKHFEDLEIKSGIGPKELAQNKEIIELIQENIDRGNRDLSEYEYIRRFYIIPEMLSVKNGLLTPSLKVKKKVVQKKYQKEINAMYLKEKS